MAHKRVYAGIDVGATSIKYGLVDVTGEVLFKEQRPTLADKGREPLLHLISNIGEHLMLSAAEEDYEIPWLGVATPGSVDSFTGTVVGMSPNIKDWKGAPLGSFLKERLNLPVWVDNDVNAMALAEHRFGAGVGYDTIICVTVGTGVGGGLIINGKLWRGSSHAAGEIGHVPIALDGPVCGCGQTGCLEAFCSSAAIVKRCRDQLESGLTPGFDAVLNGNIEGLGIRNLFAAARKKDEVALRVIAETARYLAIGLTGAVNLLNPDLVIVGGGVADGGAGFVEAVALKLRKRVCDAAAEKLRVVKAALGNQAGFVGASLLGEER
ncbi:MAG: ROK family protein [candidate division Zixibacteria bacterium]|nr:ROK family protein [candidate division Zixibacteria bacterium]